jgi:hypothetical protein
MGPKNRHLLCGYDPRRGDLAISSRGKIEKPCIRITATLALPLMADGRSLDDKDRRPFMAIG